MLEKYDSSRHNEEDVKSLLAMAAGYPTKEQTLKLLDTFYSTEGHTLFVTTDKDTVTGIIGIDSTAAPHGWILHIAVHPEHRKRGIGRSLISRVTADLSLKSAALETDMEAVGFYRACGFQDMEIVSKWPGVRRFRCTKGQPLKSVLEYYDNLQNQNREQR